MATTINSYSVGLTLDSKSYVDGSKLARGETNALIRDINQARTPTENYTRHQERLTEAYRKGAIDLATYNRLLASKKSQLGLTTPPTISYASALTAVGVAGAAAVAGGVMFVKHLRDVQGEIDETVKAGAKIGLTFNEISQLRFAAAEIGVMDANTVDSSVKRMLMNISKAVDGDERVRGAFERIGVDAGQLMKAGPVEAVKLIADGMQGVNSQADRLMLAQDIFGKAGANFVDTLSSGRAAIEEAAGFQEKWNSLTAAQTMGVEENNDAWGRVFVMVEGISTKLSAEFAPAMQLIADYILDSADGVVGIDDAVRATVDTTVYLAGVFKDIFELATVTQTVMNNIATLNFSGAVAGVNAALDFSSGEQALQALYDKRFELEQAAAKKQRELEERRKNLMDEDLDSRIEKEDKAEKERLRLLEQEEKRREQMAMKAIEAARKEFDMREQQRRKMQADIAKGPGGGMEEGSAEAAKFMAQQINAAIGADAMPNAATPGEAELIAEAKIQREQMEQQAQTMAEQVSLLQKLLDEAEQNGFSRIR
jgi:hypothetical protein